jgi:colanic acid/amylovoran biosynthesis protein
MKKVRKVLVTGQKSFGNRGCEAIVRSTLSALQSAHGSVEMLVPSESMQLDEKQWPRSRESGVRFVRVYEPWFTRFWIHFQRTPVGAIKRAGWPFSMPQWFKKQIASVDAVLAIGGDNYSLDYRLPSLWMGVDGCAMALGKKTYLWGASVGPFEREPDFVECIRKHLARFTGIVVRESSSFAYLTEGLGLSNVRKAPDPAFALEPEPLDVSTFWPTPGPQGVLGLNVSPLLERYTGGEADIITETEQFVRHAVTECGFGVLLVPHVVPLTGRTKNNDFVYMSNIARRVGDFGGAVRIAPPELNAAQIKTVISKVNYFIGARTHATIAALSSGIPTVSIAYSVKARGINRDIFGDESLVLPCNKCNRHTLASHLSKLRANEETIRMRLNSIVPQFKEAVLHAASVIVS